MLKYIEHIPKGKKVLILRKDCPRHNKIGIITNRDGEYYSVKCNGITLELYLCEILEIIQ